VEYCVCETRRLAIQMCLGVSYDYGSCANEGQHRGLSDCEVRRDASTTRRQQHRLYGSMHSSIKHRAQIQFHEASNPGSDIRFAFLVGLDSRDRHQHHAFTSRCLVHIVRFLICTSSPLAPYSTSPEPLPLLRRCFHDLLCLPLACFHDCAPGRTESFLEPGNLVDTFKQLGHCLLSRVGHTRHRNLTD
jgi:hypothetical protein